MAFTKAPTQDTYSSHRVPAFHNLDIRPGSFMGMSYSRSNAGTVNLVPLGKKGEEITAQLRLPLVGKELATNGMRGIFVWSFEYGAIEFVVYYAAVNNQVYWSSDGSVWNSIITWTSTEPVSSVGFCEFINSSGVKSLVIVDGEEGYVIDSSTYSTTATKITDADFPTPHTPHPVFIDGYLFLAKVGTGDIYNSNLDNPAAWTAGNFISSEVYPDKIKALVKINNYLLAIGSSGCEFFYDAGNATGSPLARYEGAVLPFGCLNVQTLAANKNTVVFLANMNDGEAALMVIEDFKYKNITPPWLIAYLSGLGTDTAYSYGFLVRQYGQLLYCLSVWDGIHGTFFYCFDNEMWGEFDVKKIRYTAFATSDEPLTFYGANAGPGTGKAVFGCMASTTASPFVAATGAWDSLSNDSVKLSDGTVSSAVIAGTIRLPALDFGTNNLKTMSRMSFNLEPTMLNAVYPVLVTVTHYNDDRNIVYATQSFSYTDDNTFLTQQGAFRRRRINIELRPSDTGVRVHWIEFDINKGQQ